MKNNLTFCLLILLATIFNACKKTTTTTVVKNKVYTAPVLAEVTSMILLQMPSKSKRKPNDMFTWDYKQTDETGGPDVHIDILDSIPYYALYQGGYIKYDLTNDSLPKIFGGQQNHSLKINNLTNKFHIIVLDMDKNYEEDLIALLPFRLSDYNKLKPNQILLTNQDSTSKVLLNVIWY